MKTTTAALSAVLFISAGALVTGCSGGISATPGTASSASVEQSTTGVAAGPRSYAANVPIPEAKPRGNLYVSDLGRRAVLAFVNRTYTPNGLVRASLPNGEWTDPAFNLYVTNFTPSGGYVQENACTAGRNARCSNTPFFRYTKTLANPVSVTTDRRGNVYVTDDFVGGIAEFPQGVDKVTNGCAILGFPQGVAVDSSTGDTFMSYIDVQFAGHIMEFKGGLRGCHGRILGVTTLTFPGGMILDAKRNLIVTDRVARSLDIVAPPYETVTGTCGGGYGSPSQVALSRNNSRLYVADPTNANVQVYDYPACTRVTMIGAGKVIVPVGVTDTYNFVP